MAANESTICNLALREIGDKSILTLDDNSEQAIACKQVYYHARDELLQLHRWNFAIKRVTLSRLSDSPVFGWEYQYQLPEDCLRVLKLNGWDDWQQSSNWEIEGNKLLTCAGMAQLRYVSRVEDASLYTPLFVRALAVKVASGIAPTLAGSMSIKQSLIEEFERLTGPQARRSNEIEINPRQVPQGARSMLVGARGGGWAGNSGGCGTGGVIPDPPTPPTPSPSYIVYVGYASDDQGADYSTTPASGLDYVAFLSRSSAMPTPSASDFAGLWREYIGGGGGGGMTVVEVSITNGSDEVDFTVPSSASEFSIGGIRIPTAGDAVSLLSIERINSTTVRGYLSSLVPSSDYVATLLYS